MAELPAWWTDRFGELLPVGHQLRRRLPDRWLRIHSLPGSKRYAESPEERELLFSRHATLGAEVLGEDPGWLVTPGYEPAMPGETRSFERLAGRVLTCVASIRGLAGRDDELFAVDEVSFWSMPYTRWEAEAERAGLLAVADDQLRALWLNGSTGELYAPYDGGVDLILSDRDRRDRLATRFAAWRSSRADGL